MLSRSAHMPGRGDQHGDHLEAVALDVTDADAVRAAVTEAVGTFGRLDVVVQRRVRRRLRDLDAGVLSRIRTVKRFDQKRGAVQKRLVGKTRAR